MCFDNTLTCSQYYTTISGSFCTGGTFTTALADFRCNSLINRATITTSSCVIEVGTNNCFSNTAAYKTATVSAVYLVGPVSSPCYSPLAQAQTQSEVIVFRTGTVNGVIATGSSSPSSSPRITVNSSGSSGNTGGGPDNTVIIIIAVVAGVVLIVAGVVGFLVVKKMKKKSEVPNQVQQPFIPPPQQYPSQTPYYGDNRPTSVMYPPYQQPPSSQPVYFNSISTSNPSTPNYAPPPNQYFQGQQPAMLAPAGPMPYAPPK
ncbi:hypothetical protein HK098_002008 [Nowakowskiella sp. JEL0407]|nr:hypothetical protein HK098_002008 [Nowakowskiella sp. JEL0407]